MEKEIRELVTKYIKGEVERDFLIQIADKYYNLKVYHKESAFYNLLEELFEDPDDNELQITRDSIIQVLDNFIKKTITLEDVELWFWDVFDLNILGEDSEQELIIYLLHLFDNIEINGITDIHIIKVIETLKCTSNSEKAEKKIQKIFAN